MNMTYLKEMYVVINAIANKNVAQNDCWNDAFIKILLSILLTAEVSITMSLSRL
jgi:hypothetical protein